MRISLIVIVGAAVSFLTTAHNISFLEKKYLSLAGGPPYKQTLGCGACLKGNFVYCVKNEGDPVESEASITLTDHKCCLDDTCAEASSADWTCSNVYSDSIYAKSICPFVKSKCGTTNTISFGNVTDKPVNLSIDASNGTSQCFYKMDV
jgi:hypothetical protein